MSKVEKSVEKEQRDRSRVVQFLPGGYVRVGFVEAKVREQNMEITREIDKRRLQEIRGTSEEIDNQTSDEPAS